VNENVTEKVKVDSDMKCRARESILTRRASDTSPGNDKPSGIIEEGKYSVFPVAKDGAVLVR
jgi:hypothetical protein